MDTVTRPQPDRNALIIEEEDILISSIYSKILSAIPDRFPGLHGIGFGGAQLKQIIEAWKLVEDIPLERLPESLRYAEFELSNNLLGHAKDKLSYVLVAIKNGEYRRPKNYKSAAEIMAEEHLFELKRLKAVKDEIAELEFEDIWSNPDTDTFKRLLGLTLPNYQAAYKKGDKLASVKREMLGKYKLERDHVTQGGQ
jgi:hypothetical protein